MNKPIEQYDMVKNYVNAIMDNIRFADQKYDAKSLSDHRKHFGLRHFNQDMRTIKLSIPRQNGNTSIVVSLLDKLPYSVLYLRKFKDKQFYERKFDIEPNRIFTRVEDLNGENLWKLKYVIVDMASYMEPKELDSLYNLDAEFFIFIQ